MSVNRGHQLRFLHSRRPMSGEAYEVKVPRKFWRFFTAHSKTYLTIDHHKEGRVENDHWFVMLTNRPDGHQRCSGGPAVAVDFRVGSGKLYQRPSLSGVWESSFSMWPVEEEENKQRIFNHVHRVIGLAYEAVVAKEAQEYRIKYDAQIAEQAASVTFWEGQGGRPLLLIAGGLWIFYALYRLFTWEG